MKNLTIYCLFLMIGASVFAQEGFDKFSTKNPVNTFIGAVIEADKINSDTHEFLDVPQKSITISYSFPIKSQEIVPSYNNMMNMVEGLIKNGDVPTQNVAFSYITREIKSYDELSLFFGQKINPTLLFGIPVNGKPKQNVVAVSLEQKLLSLYMDIQDAPVIDNSEIEKDKLLYLNSVTFGRKAIVLIESNQSESKIKAAVDDVVQNYDVPTKIADSSHSLLANSTIRVMIAGDNTAVDIQAGNSLLDALHYFNLDITANDFGAPIIFTAAWLKDNSMFVNDIAL